MTLEETIKYHKELAEEFRQEAERIRDFGEHISSPNQPYNEPVKCYRDCAKEHEELAEWLTQLKRLKEAYEFEQVDDLIQVCLDIWG